MWSSRAGSAAESSPREIELSVATGRLHRESGGRDRRHITQFITSHV